MSHEYREFTVLLEMVADNLEIKGTSTKKALRDAVSDYSKAVANPRSASIKPKDLTPEMVRRLANG
jgi:hypothetical protein